MIPAREIPHVATILFRSTRSHLGGPPTRGAQCLAIRHDGAFLLVKASYRRFWSLPGGFMDPGEDPVDAARRELLEEVGLTVDAATLVGIDSRRYHIDHLVSGLVNAATVVREATTAWEIGAVRWVTPTQYWSSIAALHPHSHRLVRLLPGGLDRYVSNQLMATPTR